MSKKDLFDEYCIITSEIEKLNKTVDELRQSTKIKVGNCLNDNEKDIIFKQFKINIENIKNNVELKKTYKNLKIRQNEIYTLLTNEIIDNSQAIEIFDESLNIPIEINESIENLSNIEQLLNKYKKINTERLVFNIPKISNASSVTNERFVFNTPKIKKKKSPKIIITEKYTTKMDKLFKYLKI